jgi:hypothetical protein
MTKRRFHHESEHGPGPRRPLAPSQRLDWRLRVEKSYLARQMTESAWRLARALERLLGADGELTPSYDTLAAVAGVGRRSVPRALVQLSSLGFVRKTRRLITEDGETRQTSNAYELLVPGSPPPPVLSLPAPRTSRAISYLDSSSAIVAPRHLPVMDPAARAARFAAKIAEEKVLRRARIGATRV